MVYPTEPIIVGIIGLPSAGKTTLINSIIGKRVLHTGVCRTTTNVHLIGHSNVLSFPNVRYHNEKITDDDGNTFLFLDLPGIADAENKGKEQNFDELTMAWITRCNLIYWMTDINTAFLTTHEKQEFDKIHALLKKLSTETGTLYQVAILLSKYDFIDNIPIQKKQTQISDGEICDEYEDTTVIDCYKRVEKLFEGTNVPLFKINAFGRIKYGKTSEMLKKLITNVSSPKNCYTQFSIGWAVKDLFEKQQISYVKSLIEYIFPKHQPPKQQTLNCRHGYSIHVMTCPYVSYCGCSTGCGCGNYCEFHGNCGYGVPKFNNTTTCSGGESCKYHRTKTCLWGQALTASCSQMARCPQHNRKTTNTTYEKITDSGLLLSVLKFMLITSQTELDDWKKEYKMANSITTYDVNKWNSFSSSLGKNKLLEKEFDSYTNYKNDENILYRMIHLIDNNNIKVTRLYINVTKEGSKTALNLTFGLPKTFTCLPNGFPDIFKHDIEFTQKREISCNVEWLKQIKEIRKTLWSNEDNVDLHMVLMNVWFGKLSSIFAQID